MLARLHPRVIGLFACCLWVAGVGISFGQIVEFPIPTPICGAQGITVGADGNLWFTEYNAGKIGRITPSGLITEFVIPSSHSGPNAISAGPDGNVWFTESYANAIGRITPDGTITEFPIPTPGFGPIGIASGPDGNVWFTDGSNGIGRITPTGVISQFGVASGVIPFSIVANLDGNLWFTDLRGAIGKITPGGTVTEYSTCNGGAGFACYSTSIAASPDGDLWLTDNDGNIGAIDTFSTRQLSGREVKTISDDGLILGGITVAPDGDIWVTVGVVGHIGFSRVLAPRAEVGSRLHSADSGPTKPSDEGVTDGVARITPSGSITEFAVPNSVPSGIVIGPDGAVWFAETLGNKIGRINICMPDAATLCSGSGRFRARVDWQASSSNGNGQAVPLTSNTGAFWFFDPTNIELVVKVLDGRSINGKWWVFYGSLTNVAFTLTVTDTQTGAVRAYTNPQGQLASVADTSAF